MIGLRKVIKSVTIGVADTTVDDFSEIAGLIGAPADARITTGGGPMFIPGEETQDYTYPYQVTFTWVEEV